MITHIQRQISLGDRTKYMSAKKLKTSIPLRTMRAVLVNKFGSEEVLTVQKDVDVPKIDDDEVLVKIKASGINPVDTYIRAGTYANLPQLPYIPGKDGAGDVYAVGSLVSKFKVGDPVFCSSTVRYGTLGEFTAMKEKNVFPLHQRLSYEEGACLGIPYFTAFHAIFHKAKAQKTDRVLVHGASGAVGLAAVQIAKAHGMSVVGTAGTEDGLQLVKSMGADEIYNHRDKNYLKSINQSGNFDVILEMLANVNLQHDLTLMKPRGRTVIIGCRGDIKISPRLLMGPESSIIGCALLNATPEEKEDQVKGIIKGIEEGWVKPVVHKVYSLDQAKEAHYDIINSKGARGNLIVKVSEE